MLTDPSSLVGDGLFVLIHQLCNKTIYKRGISEARNATELSQTCKRQGKGYYAPRQSTRNYQKDLVIIVCIVQFYGQMYDIAFTEHGH